MNGNFDSRAYWRSLALLRNKIISKLQADYDAVETELKQYIADCTCRAKDPGHGN